MFFPCHHLQQEGSVRKPFILPTIISISSIYNTKVAVELESYQYCYFKMQINYDFLAAK